MHNFFFLIFINRSVFISFPMDIILCGSDGRSKLFFLIIFFSRKKSSFLEVPGVFYSGYLKILFFFTEQIILPKDAGGPMNNLKDNFFLQIKSTFFYQKTEHYFETGWSLLFLIFFFTNEILILPLLNCSIFFFS